MDCEMSLRFLLGVASLGRLDSVSTEYVSTRYSVKQYH